MSKASSLCSCSPSCTLPPPPGRPRWYRSLTGARALSHDCLATYCDVVVGCMVDEVCLGHPGTNLPVSGQTVFQEASPWCWKAGDCWLQVAGIPALPCTCRRWVHSGHAHDTLLSSPCSTGSAAGRQLLTEEQSQAEGKSGPAGCRAGPGGGCPAGLTWSGCTRCHLWWRCWTMAGSCRASCGPGGRSCVGWSRGSGWLAQSPGAGCSPRSSTEGGRR